MVNFFQYIRTIYTQVLSRIRGLPVRGTQTGFSLVELLLVVSIFVIISTVVIASYNKFNSRTLLNSLAYDIALTLREAQVYAFSVLEESLIGGGSTGFTAGYGMYFEKAEDSAYIFFADVDENGFYDKDVGGTFCSNECLEQFTLRGYTVSDVCGKLAGSGDAHCFSYSTNSIEEMSVTFVRPDPDAYFKSDCTGDTYSEIAIEVSSIDAKRYVKVATTGQISVESAAPSYMGIPASSCQL